MFSLNGAAPSNQTCQQQEHLTPHDPFELRDQILCDNAALRALSVLLRTAKLSEFDTGYFTKGTPAETKAQELQYGLGLLLDFCLDRQEGMLEDYAQQYLESDEYRLKNATRLISMARRGAFIPGVATLHRLQEALDGLNRIIASGGELQPMAEQVRQELLNLHLFKESVSEVEGSAAAATADVNVKEVA